MRNYKEELAEKITSKTSLMMPEDIRAYSYFCKHANCVGAEIMYGDVQHEFYVQILQEASLPMTVLERAYNEAIGNHIHEDLEGNRSSVQFESRLKSPIAKAAQQEFAKYYHKFIYLQLVSSPEKTAHSQEYYPKLKGYNYFNDPDFYRSTKDGNGRELVI